MLLEADEFMLFVKEKSDALLESDWKLQDFISWVSQKSKSVKTSLKPAIVRSCYFDIGRGQNPEIAKMYGIDFPIFYTLDYFSVCLLKKAKVYGALEPEIALDWHLACAHARALDLATGSFSSYIAFQNEADVKLDMRLYCAIYIASALNYSELEQALRDIKVPMPMPPFDKYTIEMFNQSANLLQPFSIGGYSPGEMILKIFEETEEFITNETTPEIEKKLRNVMIEYRNLKHGLKFSEHQINLLEKYYKSNTLTLSLLNSDCSVSSATKQLIEKSLFLPSSKTESGKQLAYFTLALLIQSGSYQLASLLLQTSPPPQNYPKTWNLLTSLCQFLK